MKKVSMILLSGGIGQRMKINVPKQFLLLGGKPMIVHTLERVEKISEIDEIIIPSPKHYLEQMHEIIANYGFRKKIFVIEGGVTRQESTYLALTKVLHPTVIIHEAVRPFVKEEEFRRLINHSNESALYGVEIPFTVLEGKDYIEQNLNRSRLVNIQLPQKFNTDQLLKAHEQARVDNLLFTEDASLLFHYTKEKISILEGTEYNIKITKPIDRKIAEIIYKEYILEEG